MNTPWKDKPFAELLRLSWPIAVSTVSYSVMTLVDTLLVGHIGRAQLAGVGLGGVTAFVLLCFSFGLLQGAKVAENPLPLLKDAKKQLQQAARNKGGRRVEAIEAVDEAILLAQAGHKDQAVSKITHAIALVRSGMDRGR